MWYANNRLNLQRPVRMDEVTAGLDRTRPGRASGGRTSAPRESILEVATRLFGERGYAATTMRDIAKSVGILPGSLYAHIESKDAVLLEIIEGGVDRFNTAVARVESQQLSPPDTLVAICREHVRIVADNPGRTQIVFHQWRFLAEPHLSRLLAKRGRYERFFTDTVAAGVRSGDFDSTVDVRITVFGLLGALNWIPEWFSSDGPATADQVADTIVSSMLEGLRPRT